MNKHWDLSKLYQSFDDDLFKKDRAQLTLILNNLENWQQNSFKDSTEKAEQFVEKLIDFYQLYVKLNAFSQLTVSTDASNIKSLKVIEELEKEATRLTGPRVKFQQWLGSLDSLNNLTEHSPLLKKHHFTLKELLEKNLYLLSEAEEIIISKLKQSGSAAWTRLQQKLTSTLMIEVEIEGETKTLPLPEVRNLAFKKDPQIRWNGYEAELNAYQKIEEPVAAALNGIKGEVLTISEKRGFNHPLDETLLNSRMERETLETMLEAMSDFLPHFHEFYKTKARLLGHEEGLPYYDLFAPLGKVDLEFSLDEARAFIIDNIGKFSSEMAALYNRAFSESWIDTEPRKGKRGGAFCANIHPIGESRILSNFTGSFTDMITLAHELGHVYHGFCLNEESILNSSYPMPLAETASIFSETVVTNAALEETTPEQAFAILESRISHAGQVIVDIYSRYIFETELFESRKNASLSVEELKTLMSQAQKEAYGDALDHRYLHPYAWLNKPHYYMAGNNYYNFPYAFGLLFGLGIYALYLERGAGFLEDYKKLLAATGKNKVKEVATMVGIDLDSRRFWEQSLEVIKKDLAIFMAKAQSNL